MLPKAEPVEIAAFGEAFGRDQQGAKARRPKRGIAPGVIKTGAAGGPQKALARDDDHAAQNEHAEEIVASGLSLVGGATEAVEHSGPFRGVGGLLHGDPVKALRIQAVEGSIEARSVGERRAGHFMAKAQPRATARGQGIIRREKQKRRARAVVMPVHSGRCVRARSRSLCDPHSADQRFDFRQGDDSRP
jgi:hypothetical protein